MLKTNQSEYTCVDEQSGLRLTIHDQGEEALPDLNGFYVEMGTEMHFVLEIVSNILIK